MKILSLDIEGFRSLKRVDEWRPGDLNILIGPNASGKSNLLRALDLLAVSLRRVGQSLCKPTGEWNPWCGTVPQSRFGLR